MSSATLSRFLSDRRLATLVGLVSFVVYLSTGHPGLIGPLPHHAATDVALHSSPKLQYVGRVLGTLEPPGYPLYVMVSYVVSLMPWGSLAYRINLMACALAALTVSLTFLAARTLGCVRIAALVAMLGLAFGRTFWSQAVVANVHILTAALAAGIVWSLLRWSAGQRPSFLFLAVGLFAAALGNHPVIFSMFPAAVAYVWAVGWRSPPRSRLLFGCMALLLTGMAQYVFILVRTLQSAPWLETRASSPVELVTRVMSLSGPWHWAGADASAIFQTVVVTIRSFASELGASGAALAFAGLAALVRAKSREATLMIVGIAGSVAMAALNGVDQIRVLLVPAFILLWLLVAVGLSWLAARPAGRSVAPLVAALALFIPASQLLTNHRLNNHRSDTFYSRYFDALFEALPNRAAIVTDGSFLDQMVLYKTLGERLVPERRIVLVEADANTINHYRSSAYAIYAFAGGRKELESRDGFGFVTVQLRDVPLFEYLALVPPGSIVALVGGHRFVASLPPRGTTAFYRIGGTAGVFNRLGRSYGIIGISGARRGAAEQFSVAVDVHTQRGTPIGRTDVISPVNLHASSDGTSAGICMNGREVVRAETGLAIAVIAPDGALMDGRVVESQGECRVRFNMQDLPFFRLVGRTERSHGSFGSQTPSHRISDQPVRNSP